MMMPHGLFHALGLSHALGLLSQAPGLSAAGMVVMIGCVGLVCGMMAFCYYRLLREPRPSEHHHAPLDIDTHDTD